MTNLPSILFCCPIPPPITGQAFVSNHLFLNYRGKKFLVNQNFEGSGFIKKVTNTIISEFKIVFLLSTNKIDLVYFTCSRSLLGSIKDLLTIFFSYYFFKKKIVTHLHGSDLNSFYTSSNPIFRYILRKLYQKIDIAIVLADEMAEQFKMINGIKVVTLNNFYDPLWEGLEYRSQRSEKIVISYFSNIMYSKGILLVIESFKRVFEINKNVELHIAGSIMKDDNISKSEMENIFFKSISNFSAIKYHGQISGVKKRDFLLQSDILLFPSFYKSEAFSISIIEAMKCGNIIITSKQGYHHNIVNEENGIVLNNISINEIVLQIEQVLIDKEKITKTKQNNIEKATKYYSLSSFIQNFEKVVKDIN